jgi:hypothetical protein
MSNTLSKLRINAFLDLSFNSAMGQFEAYYNPESFQVGYKVEYSRSEGLGALGSALRFVRIPPKTFSFELLIDGTGASGEKVDVPKKVKHFLNLTQRVVGHQSRPPFLILTWGTFVEKCVLESLNVSYNLFQPDGKPLRAQLSCSFSTVSSQELAESASNRIANVAGAEWIVKAGDTLPMICEAIYGSASLYMAVAKANKLVNLKDLKVGQRISLPALLK